MLKFALYGATLLAGICNAVEPGQNATLSKGLGQPWLAALVLLVVNAVIFVAAGLITHRLSVPGLGQMEKVPWWAWLGGVTSAVIIVAQLFVSEQIGAGRFLGLIVTAGVVTSILLDNYGLVGFKQHHASIWRILGGGMMIVGVGLVSLF